MSCSKGTGEKDPNWSQICSTIAANWPICNLLTMKTRTQQKAKSIAPMAANSKRASTRHFLRTARFSGGSDPFPRGLRFLPRPPERGFQLLGGDFRPGSAGMVLHDALQIH